MKIGLLALATAGLSAVGGTLPSVECEVRTVGPGGGGYLIEICASRHHPDRVYVGCDVGGFYRSDDLGGHYRILNAGLETLFVNEIAEHPTDPETLLIGTKGGLFKSVDGGLHWKDLRPNATPYPRPDMFGHSWPISRIAWCERNPQRVWAATGVFATMQRIQGKVWSEVWRSDDGGESWRMVVKPGDPLLEEKAEVLSLTAHHAKRDELLLTTSKSVFLSTDGGETWTRSMAGISEDGQMQVRYAGRCAAKPDVVYVTLRQRQGEWKNVPFRSAIYRSDDGGRNWTACGRPRVNPQGGRTPWAWNNEATCVVDPKDPDTVWTTGPTWFLGAVCKSTDGGRTWREFSGIRPGWIDFWGIGARPLAVSPINPQRVFFGTSGHVFATLDGGETWNQRYSEDRTDGKISGSGLEVTCIRFMESDCGIPGRWYIGYWDIGLMISDDGGRSMRRCMEGIPIRNRNSCFHLIQAPDDPKLKWATFGNWSGPDTGGIFAESRDCGETWTVKTNGWRYSLCPSLACVTDRKPYVLAAASVVPSRDEEKWTGLQMSFDGGDSWREVDEVAFPEARAAHSVCAADGVLFVGTSVDGPRKCNGGVWKSSDLGRTWTRLTPPDMKMEHVNRLVVRGDLIVAQARTAHFPKNGGGCYLSADAGRTWQWVYPAAAAEDVALSPDGRTIALAVPPMGWRDPGLTGDGVVVSRDRGKTWKHLVGPGVDKLIATHLAFDPNRPRDLWCGTGGNSVIVLRLPVEF